MAMTVAATTGISRRSSLAVSVNAQWLSNNVSEISNAPQFRRFPMESVSARDSDGLEVVRQEENSFFGR
jgi:hypothetical protein